MSGGGLRVAAALLSVSVLAFAGCRRAPQAPDAGESQGALPAQVDWQRVAADVYLLGEEYDESREKEILPQRRPALSRLLSSTAERVGEGAPDILRRLSELQQRLAGPVDHAFFQDCMDFSAQIARRAGFSLTPAEKPSLERGAKVYAKACAACHGEHLDGKSAAGARMDPRPSDLLHPERSFRPYDMFARVSYGGLETAMPAFADALSAGERWDLVFFLFAVRWFPCRSEVGPLSASELAVSTDFDLSRRMPYEAIACARRNFTPPAGR